MAAHLDKLVKDDNVYGDDRSPTCHLLDLPVEIRQQILQCLLCSAEPIRDRRLGTYTIEPKRWDVTSVMPSHSRAGRSQSIRETIPKDSWSPYSLYPEILATCKTLNAEGTDILYQNEFEICYRVGEFFQPYSHDSVMVLGQHSLDTAINTFPALQTSTRWRVLVCLSKGDPPRIRGPSKSRVSVAQIIEDWISYMQADARTLSFLGGGKLDSLIVNVEYSTSAGDALQTLAKPWLLFPWSAVSSHSFKAWVNDATSTNDEMISRISSHVTGLKPRADIVTALDHCAKFVIDVWTSLTDSVLNEARLPERFYSRTIGRETRSGEAWMEEFTPSLTRVEQFCDAYSKFDISASVSIGLEVMQAIASLMERRLECIKHTSLTALDRIQLVPHPDCGGTNSLNADAQTFQECGYTLQQLVELWSQHTTIVADLRAYRKVENLCQATNGPKSR